MTNSNVAATTSTAKIVHESPSPLRIWWMNKNLRYDIAMNSFVIILNIAAILYRIIHKIPSNEGVDSSLIHFAIIYFVFGLGSCIVWIVGITDPSQCEVAYRMGSICHNVGLAIFLHLLYYISPRLVFFVGMHFNLPYWLWYVAAMLGPSLSNGMQALRVWWKFVSQPQAVVIKSN